MKVKRLLPVIMALLMFGGVAFAGCTPKNDSGNGQQTEKPSDGEKPEDGEKPSEGEKPEDGEKPGGTQHVHDYEGQPIEKGDENGHYQVCKGEDCNEKKVVAHTYTTHKVTCDYCDYHNPKATTLKGWDGTDTGFTDDGVSQIYVVGDSTLCDYNKSPQKFDTNRFLPRYGYGTQLHEYFNYTSENVVNLAISGRSAVSLMGEDNYTTLVNSIGEGDYLIIGFGHNDEKLEPNRFGDPEGKIDEPVTDRGDSWKYILNENYIKLAKHRGATPILCTPIVRYDAKGEYTGNYVHDTDYGNYPKAIKELGEATDTTVVDLTTITKTVWTAAGNDAKYFHSVNKYAGDIVSAPYGATVLPDFESIDGTHVNKFGAKMIAYQLANALKSTPLASIVKDNITAPVKTDATYTDAINQEYVQSTYSSFVPENNEAVKVTDGWYKTAFGDLGGSYSESKLTATYDSEKFTVSYSNKGKIASSGDGLAAIFKQLSVNDDFTITAHAKVTTYDASTSKKQAAFGIMLRDDIYINYADTALKSDYVTAGALTKENAADYANFSRKDGSVKNGEALTAEVAVGTEVDLEMTKAGNKVTVKFGDVSSEFTVGLNSVDSNYMYLCLFANRGLTVEFTNVNFALA